jgi:hypothetical protein
MKTGFFQNPPSRHLFFPSPPRLRVSAVKKSFLTSAKNIVFLREQNLPYLLIKTPIFSQRFMKKINRVNRTMR